MKSLLSLLATIIGIVAAAYFSAVFLVWLDFWPAVALMSIIAVIGFYYARWYISEMKRRISDMYKIGLDLHGLVHKTADIAEKVITEQAKAEQLTGRKPESLWQDEYDWKN